MLTLGRYARGCGEPPSPVPARLPARPPNRRYLALSRAFSRVTCGTRACVRACARECLRACVRACWFVKTPMACVCCVLTGRSRLSQEPTSSSSVAAVRSAEIPARGSRRARPLLRVLAQCMYLHVPACTCIYLHVHAQSPAPSPAQY